MMRGGRRDEHQECRSWAYYAAACVVAILTGATVAWVVTVGGP